MKPAPLNRTDYRALAFLQRGALVRSRGAWRFGGTEVGDSVVDRLIAHRRVIHLFPGQPGECVVLRQEA